ncbi:hypothetical protein B7R54_18105 [Subtercola boreus]|uniref:Uncharacterized protein n=1 Tax=Subtercola boreus TaxID=120213 RepID=A0A3E0VLY1_9MICO|nr:hypothetical protein [Subtercola boreus]RFA10906.1 hypothetical protein B7R54_18105 [Subtercola boreus]
MNDRPQQDDRTAVSLALTETVRKVHGVSEVYSSAPVVVATVSKVTQLVTRGAVSPDVVAVSEVDGELVVAVTIGVSEGVSATQVCRDVYDAIAEQLGAALSDPLRPLSIAVKVARIG